MPRTIKPCRFCEEDITQDGVGGEWRINGGTSKRCEASPTLRHKPINALQPQNKTKR